MVAHQSKRISSVNLMPGDQFDGTGVRITPFSLGVMGPDESSSPDSYLKGVLDARFVAKVDGSVEVRRIAALQIRLGKHRPGKPPRMTFCFDPAHGFLPIKITDTDPETGKKQYDAYVLEFKDCGNGRWFPMRGVVVFPGADPTGTVNVQETKVVELDPDRANDEMFYLDIPSGTQVTISQSPYYVNILHDERITVDKLDSLWQRCIQHGEEQIERERAAGLRDGQYRILNSAYDTRVRWVVALSVIAIVLALLITLRARKAYNK